MTAPAHPPPCPRCQSPATAPRRELFYRLMEGPAPDGAFTWYSDREPRACPPKSIFIVLFFALLALALPALVLWQVDHYPALLWFGGYLVLLLLSFIADLLMTYRRYQRWAQEWLCGDCRHFFIPGSTA